MTGVYVEVSSGSKLFAYGTTVAFRRLRVNFSETCFRGGFHWADQFLISSLLEQLTKYWPINCMLVFVWTCSRELRFATFVANLNSRKHVQNILSAKISVRKLNNFTVPHTSHNSFLYYTIKPVTNDYNVHIQKSALWPFTLMDSLIIKIDCTFWKKMSNLIYNEHLWIVTAILFS